MIPHQAAQGDREERIVFWVIVVGMAVVVGGAALVALGAGGAMPEAVPDRLTARLPAERPLGRADVDELRLPMAVRGYRMDEVDDVLDRLGAELALRDARIAELETAVAGERGEQALAAAGAEPVSLSKDAAEQPEDTAAAEQPEDAARSDTPEVRA
ncbi:DivIVA domain-containing protein [Streptomyces sp. NPDC092296]|uniref:DivIVA domain-containing protein n=1 Tax=Streptomyces sp. NPDC092296 TaxID=3366012 RepID=UPI00381F1352